MAGNVNFPSISELGQMEFMAPGQFQQAQNQIGLADQFAQQNLAQGGQDLQAQVLKNLFDSQNNPQLLQQKALQNQGMGFENMIKGVQAQDDMDPEYRAAKRQKMLAQMNEDQLKALMSKAQVEMNNDDPTIAARAEKALMHSWAETQRRLKHKDDMEKTNAMWGYKKDIADNAEEGKNKRAQEAIDAQNQRHAADMKLKAEKLLANPKETLDQALARNVQSMTNAKTQAERDQAQENFAIIQQAILAQKNALSGTKIDLGAATGMPMNPVQTGIPATIRTPLGGAAGPTQPIGAGATNPAERGMASAIADLPPRDPAREAANARALLASGTLSKEDAPIAKKYAEDMEALAGKKTAPKAAVPNVPAGAVQMLKGNPALASAFDAKYGPGAAKAILGN